MSSFWLWTIGVLWIGAFLGFLFKTWIDYAFRSYNGTILVDKDERSEKIVYSLVLDDYPETLEFKKVVIFKVDHPEES